jgi:hypothetical protein
MGKTINKIFRNSIMSNPESTESYGLDSQGSIKTYNDNDNNLSFFTKTYKKFRKHLRNNTQRHQQNKEKEDINKLNQKQIQTQQININETDTDKIKKLQDAKSKYLNELRIMRRAQWDHDHERVDLDDDR